MSASSGCATRSSVLRFFTPYTRTSAPSLPSTSMYTGRPCPRAKRKLKACPVAPTAGNGTCAIASAPAQAMTAASDLSITFPFLTELPHLLDLARVEDARNDVGEVLQVCARQLVEVGPAQRTADVVAQAHELGTGE